VTADPDQATTRLEPPWLVPEEFELAGRTWMAEMVDSLSVELHPLLGKLTRVRMQDGPQPVAPGEEPPPEASTLFRPMELSHEWLASVEAAVRFDRDSYLSDLYSLADDLGGQMLKGMFEHIAQVSEEHGRSVDATDRDFFDVFIESLEDLEISFNEDGSSNLTIVMHPEQADKLRGRSPTPEQEAKLDEILERKRIEWFAARRRRELP
jgi:hypothetical protein